ncbi:DNA recombination protein RmuC [Segetibacter koreensis]|uniref:DNA recombination protein RmuC n=1 Tax=Segetibacter koreensis TaxID=398037 RepID=UPI00037E5320|nr:DNA recombination protein RmuC [Segetibacter koreensis]
MTIIYIALSIITILLVINLIISLNTNNSKENEIGYKLESLKNEIQRIDLSVKAEIAGNRKEVFDNAALARKELASSLFSFEEKLNHMTSTIDYKLTAFKESNGINVKETRTEIKLALEVFKKDLSQSIHKFNSIQKDSFYALLSKQTEQNTDIGTRLDSMRQTLEKKIAEMQKGNEQKLEQMRITVDEKLQQTLEARLGQSFKLVSERLEAVHKGLGDMQQLATGVGDLKRVLSNVKTRGVLGEYQLESLLEQILTQEQYGKNVKTKQGSNAVVEFAVKLPGRQHIESTVWLPIDSKFPKEAFELLLEAYDHGDAELVEEHRRTFTKGIKNCAQDICSKYIDAPNTTDFAVLFLPFESLYAEVLRTPGLFEAIQRECKIIITGPTTLSALLNSLQMGFRTLAIEKRSGEVWQLLSAVKTEFGNFSTLLQKAQNNIQTGLNQLEDVVGKRTRAIQKRLKGVETLSDEQVKTLIPELANGELLNDDDE